ncbi:hypothetical protein C5167_048491 [Papaver somniferum]|uniref:Angiotensin-converting enzyme 2 n=1 Tax=Papaver somniferum TaxID=3469 RepID=A0A4Y7KM39_PAPSO|nr:uncharacterized protein LOC113304669 [Papaver somniferum]RZC73009.1 hypothetical protein C5167_048491 [Papaver somniferum]
MGDSSSTASYIHMVQHLIEKCLLFHMTKEECMEALFKHANIKPVITSTVWKELEKENKDFFEAYYAGNKGGDRVSESETTQKIQKMLSESSATTELSATSPASCGSSI